MLDACSLNTWRTIWSPKANPEFLDRKILSRRASGKEHEARLLSEEQPCSNLFSFAGRERRYTAWASVCASTALIGVRTPARITWRENLSISSSWGLN